MSEIVTINETNLTSVIEAWKVPGFPKPFSQNIFLTDVHVAGTTHIDNIDSIEPNLIIGQKLQFLRETDNPHDPLAIKVLDAVSNTKLGYIPKEKNEILSRLIDAGKSLYGIIHSKEFVGKWLKISIQVYLND